MKRAGILVVCCMLTAVAYAQTGQKYFVYIQNEEKTPFYVKANDRLLSGSPAGYIIVPGLQEGKNTLVIGFPKNEYPEERFTVRLGDHQDQGYLLKKSGKQSFVLYNLHDFSVLRASAAGGGDVAATAVAPAADIPAPASDASAPAADAPAAAATRRPRAVMPPPEENDEKKEAEIPSGDNLPAPDSQPASQQEPPVAAAAEPDPFAKMLNAVTGTKPAVPAPVPATKREEAAVAAPAGGQPGEVSATPRDSGGAVAGTQANMTAAPPAESPAPDENMPQETTSPVAFPPPAEEQPESGNTAEETIPLAVNKPAGVPAAQAEHRQKRKRKRQAAEEPQFITFLSPDSTAASDVPAAETEAEPAEDPADTLSKKEKRRLRKEAREEQRQQEATVADLPSPEEPAPVSPGIATGAGNAAKEEENGPDVRMINSDCREIADEEEFQKVRRKMASQHTEEGMLDAAQRYLKKECFTTAQLQSLVYLFMSDEYRYKFLDLAYPHTADTDHFSRLEKVLTQDYYKGRFRAMVK